MESQPTYVSSPDIFRLVVSHQPGPRRFTKQWEITQRKKFDHFHLLEKNQNQEDEKNITRFE